MNGMLNLLLFNIRACTIEIKTFECLLSMCEYLFTFTNRNLGGGRGVRVKQIVDWGVLID